MHQPENPARRTLLAQTVAGSAALALGSLLGGAPGVASATAETPRKAFDGGRIDVLIVGGGSAGAVLARRLSERGDRRVLLLEAGQAYPAWDYPRLIASSDSVGGDPSSDWGYQSQPGAIGHPIHAIRGKVLGGSSAINGAVAIRARREDFARWNLPGWSYDDLLPAFRRLETRQGGDPAVAPLIDLNFLAEAEDRARLLDGVKLARRIGRSEPLAGLIHAEVGPGPEARSDAQIEAAIRATLDTYHHPTSSAPMGRAGERWAVVDLEGRVHGLQGLRVIDASIFPDAISVATNITTIAVAEHLAQRIA